MTFLGKLFDEWNKEEKSTVLPMHYEESNDKEVNVVLHSGEIIILIIMLLVILKVKMGQKPRSNRKRN